MSEKEPAVLLFERGGKRYKLSEDKFADYAQSVMRDRAQDFPELKTSKLRSIYGLIMNIYTKIDGESDFEKYRADIQYLKVKMAYEAGRDDKKVSIEPFLRKTSLNEMLDSAAQSYNQWLLFCRYAESLVAYFKYYRGEDY